MKVDNRMYPTNSLLSSDAQCRRRWRRVVDGRRGARFLCCRLRLRRRGLCTVMGASIAGAAQIIAVDPFPFKREQALRHGATHAIDPLEGDVVEQIGARTGGRGADFTFEAIGLLGTMRQAFDSACPGGTVTFIGALHPELSCRSPLTRFVLKASRSVVRTTDLHKYVVTCHASSS